jgi:hypothetical protein
MLQEITKKFTLPMRRVIMRKLPSIMKPGGTKQRQQAYFARSHLIHARGDAKEAVKAHVEEHGRSSTEHRRAPAEARS